MDSTGCTGGAVITWGFDTTGGDSSSVSNLLRTGVVEITTARNGAFAALKSDGSVVTWGSSSDGGDSSCKSTELASGVEKVYGNDNSFVALKTDGSVVHWSVSQPCETQLLIPKLRLR